MIKQFFLMVLLSMLVLPGLSQNPESGDFESEEQTRLKNAAFCSCLKLSDETGYKALNDYSAAGFFELSAYNLNAFEAIDSLAKAYVQEKHISKHDGNLTLMKCLDFYNSKEMEDLILSLDGELDRSKWKE